MTKKLKPQTYYEHAKALFPEITCIRKNYGDMVSAIHSEGSFALNDNIDWGDIDQWPPKESERKWRWARMPEDWDKPARFRRYDGEWSDGVLAGYIVKDCVWLDHSLCTFDECQVEDIPAQAETPPKADRSEVVCPERENVGGSEQVPTKSLVARFCELRYHELDQEMVLQTMAGLLMQDLEIWKQLIQHPADREKANNDN